MNDDELAVVLERVQGFHDDLVKAAFDTDLIWRNVARIAGLTRQEKPAVRAYLLETYRSRRPRN